MTDPSFDGRRLSPADLATLARYRHLIAAPALAPRWPTMPNGAGGNTGDAETMMAAAGGAPFGDPGAANLSPVAHERLPVPGGGNLPRRHGGATPVSMPLDDKTAQVLWNALNHWAAKMAPYHPNPGALIPLMLSPELAPGPSIPYPFLPSPIPTPGGGYLPGPSPAEAPQIPGPLAPGKPQPPPPVEAPDPSHPPPGAVSPTGDRPDPSGPAPAPVPPTILTGPELFGRTLADLILQYNEHGSRGNPLTRKSNDLIVEECMKIAKDRYPELRHIGGATVGGRGEIKVTESYIRNKDTGQKGSSRSDGAFQWGNDAKKTAHFNTTTMRKDGTMTLGEARRDVRLAENLKAFGDGVVRKFTLRKLLPGDDFDAYRAEARGLCYDLIDRFKDHKAIKAMKDRTSDKPAP